MLLQLLLQVLYMPPQMVVLLVEARHRPLARLAPGAREGGVPHLGQMQESSSLEDMDEGEEL